MALVALFQRIVNVLFIYILSFVLLGSYIYQFLTHEIPCTFCLLQKLGMIGIMTALLMNLRFGVKVEHYGLAILSALLGRMISLKQIGLHVCPEIPQTGTAVLGLDLYIWAFIVFSASMFACAFLTILYGYCKKTIYEPTWGKWEKIAFILTFFVTITNVIAVYFECQFGFC